LIKWVKSDTYLQYPRGSNNRVNENTANRATANRLFDSQNNNKGGYNVGDAVKGASANEQQQYRMRYFESGVKGHSELEVTYTAQHGCGDDDPDSPLKLNCNTVLQYMCQDNKEATGESDNENIVKDDFPNADLITFRNGQQTTQPTYSNIGKTETTKAQVETRKNAAKNAGQAVKKGLHEPWWWYDSCNWRERNKGLFLADQEENIQGNPRDVESAIHTRQNPGGARNGYECPEERDYFPYWHPTPWRDIAVFTHNSTFCPFYEENSFNNRPYGRCVEKFPNGEYRHYSEANNPDDCDNGEWQDFHNYNELSNENNEQDCLANNNAELKAAGVVYKWGRPFISEKIDSYEEIEEQCFIAPPPIDCKTSEFSRVNHLGDKIGGNEHRYVWKLPHFVTNKDQRCVLRLRYNISTDDYDPWRTFSDDNGDDLIEMNPQVNLGNGVDLKLAINTAQFGRVFQDRSHAFIIMNRINDIPDDKIVKNLNVRGKRGNIVQTFPAVEYDYTPTRKHYSKDDLIHIQWTGSNTHNNNGDGNDGQPGDAGQGPDGTDRNNIVQLLEPDENFPRPFESSDFTKNMKVFWSTYGDNTDAEDLAIQLASSGYYHCKQTAQCGAKKSIQGAQNVGTNIENATPTYSGVVISLQPGTYHIMCTRNNNFTNRSQKGMLDVK